MSIVIVFDNENEINGILLGEGFLIKIGGYLRGGEKGLNILKFKERKREREGWGRVVDQKARAIEGVAFTFALFATSHCHLPPH